MNDVITDKGVSSGARHLFHVLKDFARGPNWPECWPFLWRLTEETDRSERMVRYYLRELERCGAIEVVHKGGKGSRYRILLGIKDKISEVSSVAPRQPIAGVGGQPIAGVGGQPIAGVVVSSIKEEAISKQAAQETEVSAAAAEENSFGEEMQKITKCAFEELVKMGLPASADMETKIALDPDFARDVLRHCKRRFGKGRKPVDNPGGYISALLQNPAKFGWVQRDGVWCDPEKPSGPSAEEFTQQEADRKALNEKERARRQAEADSAYADMKAAWDNLPDLARTEIREFVMKDSPLLHKSGANEAEFEIQCMREATSVGRTNWLRRHMGLPVLKAAWASKRG